MVVVKIHNNVILISTKTTNKVDYDTVNDIMNRFTYIQYNKQDMTYDEFKLYDLIDNTIILPRGYLYLLQKYYSNLKYTNYELNNLPINDTLPFHYDIVADSFLPKFRLRDDQILAIRKMYENKRGFLQLPTGCFVGDTKIRLLDGRVLSIEELSNMNVSGMYVISSDSNGVLYPGKLLKAYKTKEVTELINIQLNDYSVIRCTPDHLFMSRDGNWVKAEDLVENFKLMSVVIHNEDFKYSTQLLNDSHSILSISKVILNYTVSVYDLEVDTYHNFMIETSDKSGVIVHNSGKTEVMIGFLKLYKLLNISKPDEFPFTLILEPSIGLVSSTVSRFNSAGLTAVAYSDIRNDFIKGKYLPTIVVTHPKSVYNDISKDSNLLQNVKIFIGDECISGSSLILVYKNNKYFTVFMKDLYDDSSITQVVSYNIKTSLFEVKNIVRRIRNEYNDKFLCIYYKDSFYNNIIEKLLATPNHKIYTCNRGYIRVDNLTLDDYLLICRVIDGEVKSIRVKVLFIENDNIISDYRYNLEIEDNHNYIANNLLISNCHHFQSNTWKSLIYSMMSVEYSLGLSASILPNYDTDTSDMSQLDYTTLSVAGVTGNLLLKTDSKYYIDSNVLSKPVLFRLHTTIDKSVHKYEYHKIVKKGLDYNDGRNDLLSSILLYISNIKYKSLILVGTKRHAETLLKLIAKLDKQYFDGKLISNIRLSYGQGKYYKYEKNKIIDCTKLEDTRTLYDNGDINVLIGTSHIYEGTDIPNLDVVILASVGKSLRRIIQAIGRVLRLTKTGNHAYIIDFCDLGNPVLTKHSNERLSICRDVIGIDPYNIYNNITFQQFVSLFNLLEGLTY